MKFESKLVPVLREAVGIVKAVAFKRLRAGLPEKYPEQDSVYHNRLAGAVVNELFGTPNSEAVFVDFNARNRDCIQAELNAAAPALNDLRVPLTDALRVQFLCDTLEGIDSDPVLKRAKDLGILMVNREVPLPRTFMDLVRRLGVAHHLLQPSVLPDENEDSGRPANPD
ncbi:MAG: hypothetical protein WAK95_02475 [Desulfobacterales bacterium]